MYKNVLEYQKQILSCMHDTVEFEGGYFTNSDDLEYINSNSIIGVEATSDIVASICVLLANDIYTMKIQLPKAIQDFGDELDTIYLVAIDQMLKVNDDVTIKLVDKTNFDQFIEISNKLQIQEYGSVYKQHANDQLLNGNDYLQYIIEYKHQPVGEFVYIPHLNALESLIILNEYQKLGIGTSVLELIKSAKNIELFVSADNSSIEFYKKLNCTIIDQLEVVNLYGTPRNLLMYLSLM